MLSVRVHTHNAGVHYITVVFFSVLPGRRAQGQGVLVAEGVPEAPREGHSAVLHSVPAWWFLVAKPHLLLQNLAGGGVATSAAEQSRASFTSLLTASSSISLSFLGHQQGTFFL